LKKIEHFYRKVYRNLSEIVLKFLLSKYKVTYGKNIVSFGIPYLNVEKSAKCKFGEGLIFVNSPKFSTLGKCNRCKISVGENALLEIGDAVGMSNVTIVATKSIKIGHNVLLGGGVTIVDSDFHSLNPTHWFTPEDEINMKSESVIIENNVFVGMDTIILKGVTIGSNVIIAAGSVIFKNIPSNEIWGGNPATFIKLNN
jgi:acetyltransferase-like isoleucine patch superfamily enzyme